MCILFQCHTCALHLLHQSHSTNSKSNNLNHSPSQPKSSSNSITYVNYCPDVTIGLREKGKTCSSTSWHADPQPNCLACTNVCGAIEQLNALVYAFPWLKEQGLSAIESLPDWEKECLGQLDRGRRRSRGLDRVDEDDVKQEQQAQENFVKMGLKELFDDRKEHQGFGADVLLRKEGKGLTTTSQAHGWGDW